MVNGPVLDQAIHWYARQYGSTADDYERYLSGEYDRNYMDRKDQWEAHYERVRAKYNGHIMELLNGGTVRMEEINMAVIGPGLHPIGREFGNTASTEVLPKVNNIVVADFSPMVVQKAVDEIRSKVNLHKTAILPWLIDITEGISTAYHRLIQDLVKGIESEEELIAVAKSLSELTDDGLRDRLTEILTDIDFEKITSEDTAHSIFPPVFQRGGINKSVKHPYQLSVDGGTPLPLHSVFLPMVIAGTGAAAEHEIWETYSRVTSDPDRGAREDSDETRADREQMIRNFYSLISRYNTFVGSKAIGDILEDNPNATVLAVSDVSTILYNPDIGRVPRLNIDKLGSSLFARDVSLKTSGLEWEWHDEPEHYHGVNALIARLIKAKKETTPVIVVKTDSDDSGGESVASDDAAQSRNVEDEAQAETTQQDPSEPQEDQ